MAIRVVSGGIACPIVMTIRLLHPIPARGRHLVGAFSSVAAVAVAVSVGVVPGLGVTGAGTAGAATQSATVAQAKAKLLVLSDMPKGWSKEPGTTNTQNGIYPSGGDAASSGCLGEPSGALTVNPPETDTPYFQNADGQLETQDSITVFPSHAKAQAAITAFSLPKAQQCLTAVFSQAFSSQSGVTVGKLTVSPMFGAKYGTGTTGFATQAQFTKSGQTVLETTTTVFFVRGNLGQQIMATTYAQPGSSLTFPPGLIRHLVSVGKSRL